MLLSVFEELKLAGEKKSKKEKIAHIQDLINRHKSVLIFLRFVFDPNIKWLLPETDIKYRPFDGFDIEGNAYSEFYRLYLFVEGGNPNLTEAKRLSLFQQILESVDKDDAKLIHNAKNKTLKISGLTDAIFKEAIQLNDTEVK